MGSPDQFPIEGPIAANALTAATTATIAREAWADGYVLVYSAADGKLHPVAVPSGPAPSGAANLLYATPDGSSGAASLRALVVGDIANGLITNAKLANSSATVNTSGGITGGGSLALGGSLSLSLSGIPNAALANSSVTVNTSGGITGGGSLALGGSLSLSLSGIPNAALANSSLTVSAGTGLAGGGAVSLGSSTSLSVSYGSTAGTSTQGNDTRMLPTPSGAGKIPYDTGTGYSETATGGSTITVLHGGTTPAYAAVSLTADVSGTLPVSSGGTGQTSLSAHCVLIGEGTSGISVAAQGTSGQVLTSAGASADPAMLDPITGTSAESVLGSTYTVSADNGAYEDSGLSVTLPSAGTYFVITQIRANIVAVSTAGAYLLAEYYNSTDAAAVANSEQMCAYASTVGASYYNMPTMVARITVNASKTIKLYVKSVAPTSTSTRTFNSDANGRIKMYYLKTNYV